MAPPRIRKTFSGFAPDLQIDLKETVQCKQVRAEAGKRLQESTCAVLLKLEQYVDLVFSSLNFQVHTKETNRDLNLIT